MGEMYVGEGMAGGLERDVEARRKYDVWHDTHTHGLICRLFRDVHTDKHTYYFSCRSLFSYRSFPRVLDSNTVASPPTVTFPLSYRLPISLFISFHPPSLASSFHLPSFFLSNTFPRPLTSLPSSLSPSPPTLSLSFPSLPSPDPQIIAAKED